MIELGYTKKIAEQIQTLLNTNDPTETFLKGEFHWSHVKETYDEDKKIRKKIEKYMEKPISEEDLLLNVLSDKINVKKALKYMMKGKTWTKFKEQWQAVQE